MRWGSSFSDSFCVSRQGGVLSPVLFSVYLDGLLEELSDSGVGCYWGSICLLVLFVMRMIKPCASALRSMLKICSSHAN